MWAPCTFAGQPLEQVLLYTAAGYSEKDTRAPDSTSTMCFTDASRSAMAARSGSGPLGADAQAAWLGQPAQAAALPASSLCVPGQSAGRGRKEADAGRQVGLGASVPNWRRRRRRWRQQRAAAVQAAQAVQIDAASAWEQRPPSRSGASAGRSSGELMVPLARWARLQSLLGPILEGMQVAAGAKEAQGPRPCANVAWAAKFLAFRAREAAAPRSAALASGAYTGRVWS